MSEKIIVDKSIIGHWRVTLNNPPINVVDDEMYDAFYDLVGEIEADKALKVVTFESANPDFFIAHYGTAAPRSRFGVPPWIEAATQLAKSGVQVISRSASGKRTTPWSMTRVPGMRWWECSGTTGWERPPFSRH